MSAGGLKKPLPSIANSEAFQGPPSSMQAQQNGRSGYGGVVPCQVMGGTNIRHRTVTGRCCWVPCTGCRSIEEMLDEFSFLETKGVTV